MSTGGFIKNGNGTNRTMKAAGCRGGCEAKDGGGRVVMMRGQEADKGRGIKTVVGLPATAQARVGEC